MLYLRDVRPTARGGHRVIFDALELDELVPTGLPKSYDDLRVKRNTVEYPDVYTGGLKDICLAWVKQGTLFRVTEYDGSESIECMDNAGFIVA